MSADYIRIVSKTWGEERWIRNDELYCMKELILCPGFRCSLHYHKLKTETFYVADGYGLSMQIGNNITDDWGPGSFVHILPGTLHRFFIVHGWKQAVYIIECSTHHEDSDSYRIEPSGRIPE